MVVHGADSLCCRHNRAHAKWRFPIVGEHGILRFRSCNRDASADGPRQIFRTALKPFFWRGMTSNPECTGIMIIAVYVYDVPALRAHDHAAIAWKQVVGLALNRSSTGSTILPI